MTMKTIFKHFVTWMAFAALFGMDVFRLSGIMQVSAASYGTTPNFGFQLSAVKVASTFATVNVTFNASALVPGWIYCKAQTRGQLPTSVVSVLTSDYVSPYFQSNRAVTVTIKKLDGAREYSVYCAVEGADEALSLFQESIASALNVTTPCCRSMAFDAYRRPHFVFNNRSLYTNQILDLQPYFVTLSSLPDTNLTLSPVLYDSQGMRYTNSDTIIAFRPSSITFFADSPSISQSFVIDCLNSSLIADFTIVFEVSGGDAELYSTTNTSLQLVHYSALSIPAVTIDRAVFADSGLSVYIIFSTATNKTLEVNETWPCTHLFSFQSANGTTCSWLNNTAVRALFGLNPTFTALSPGKSVKVWPDKLFPDCTLYPGIDCSQLQINKISSAVVQSPYNPIKPVPILLIKPIIPCRPFTFDGTLTSGSGGRSFSATRFDVAANVTATATLTTMRSLLKQSSSSFTTKPVVYSPASTAVTAGTYYVSASLTNFLGESRTDHAIFQYNSASPNLPFVGILGPSVRTITQDQVVNFYGRGVTSTCTGVTATAGLNFSYSVQADGSTASYAVTNTALQPSYYSVQAYSFMPDSYYCVILLVDAYSPLTSAKYSNIVKVSRGQVLAVIKGGSERQISSDIKLDGSSSIDQYQQNSDVGLSYSWYCNIVSIERYGSNCDFVFIGSRCSSTISISFHSLTDVIYEVGLFVNSTADGRSGYTTVIITPLAMLQQSVNVDMLTVSASVNSDSTAVINAAINAPDTVYAIWSSKVGQEYFSLSTANTPFARYFNASVAQSTISFPLSISASNFPYRSNVMFQLSVMDREGGNLLSSSAISVTVNSPPYGGSLIVPSTSVSAFYTKVPIRAVDWSDESQLTLPLSYDFRYRPTSYTSFFFQKEESYVSSMVMYIAPGDMYDNYNVQVSLRVYNNLGAYTEYVVKQVVLPLSNINITSYLIGRINSGIIFQDVDYGFSGAASAAVYLTTVNCSAVAASYCASLNRDNCYSTPLTCGSCLSGFSGVVGDANTLCFPTGEGTAVGGGCTIHSDCLYGKCESNKCTEPYKSCPSYNVNSTCSGHGVCAYKVNSKAVNQSSCGIFNAYCTAACVCSDGYTGKSCHKDATATTEALTTYSLICQTIENMKSAALLSTPAYVDGAVAILQQASIGLAGLNAFDRCRGALTSIVDIVAQGGLSGTQSDTVNNLISIVSNFVQPGKSSYLTDQLSLIVQGIMQTRVDGQYPAEYTSSFLQMKTYNSLAFDFANQSFQAPRSSELSAYNSSVPSISFVNGGGEYCDNGKGYVEFAVGLWGVSPLSNTSATISPLLRSQSNNNQSYYFGNSNETKYLLTLPFYSPQSFKKYTYREKILLSGYNYTIPQCTAYSLSSTANSCDGCKVLTYDNGSVTYACTNISKICGGSEMYYNSNGGWQDVRRSLQAATTNSGGGSLTTGGISAQEISSIIVDAAQSFVSVLSGNPFRISINQAKPIISLLATIVALMVIGIVYFSRWDHSDHLQFVYVESNRRMLRERHKLLQELKLRRSKRTILGRVAKKMRTLGGRGKSNSDNSLYIADINKPHASRQSTLDSISDMDAKKEVIMDFLNDAIPTKQNRKKYRTFLREFAHVLFEEHDLMRMFAKPSLSEKRVTRYAKIFIRILLILFLDTLFFGQFFPDAGVCNSQLTDDTCSSILNKATGSPTCLWMGVTNTTISGNMKLFDTSCQIQSPSNSLSFIFIVALLSLILGLPFDMWFCYLLMDVCARRPDLEKWGLASAHWIGSAPLEVLGTAYPTDIEVALHPEKDILAYSESMNPVSFFHISEKGSNNKRAMHHRFFRNNMLSEQDYVSLLTYINHMSPSSEADLLVKDVQEIIERGLLEVALPWKTSEDGNKKMQQIAALTALLGVNVDGSPMPLTLRDRLSYSSQRHKLEAKIVNARQKATEVIDLVTRVADVTSYEPSIALIHVFVAEQFSPFRRFILEHQFFPHQSFYAASIDPGLWLLGIISLACSVLFFLYWILAWAVSNGAAAFRAWGYNFILVLLQEMMIIQVVEILIFYFLGMYAIEPQLIFIYRALYKIAVDIAQENEITPSFDTNLVQHLSPACRAAHTSYIRKLPAAKILRRVKDEDIQLFHKGSDVRMYPLIFIFVFLPMLLAFAGRPLSRMMLQAIVPTGSYMYILGNYYLYRLSTVALIFLYVVLVILLSYRSGILQPAAKERQFLELEKLEARNRLLLPSELHYPGRKQSWWTRLLQQLRRPITYFVYTLPQRLVTHFQRAKVVRQIQNSSWNMMNKPVLLQARRAAKIERKVHPVRSGSETDNNKPSSLLQTINATQFDALETFDKSLDLVMKSTFVLLPPKISGLRRNADGWEQGWQAQRSSFAEEYNDPITLHLRKQLNLEPRLTTTFQDSLDSHRILVSNGELNSSEPISAPGRRKPIEGMLLGALMSTAVGPLPTQDQTSMKAPADHLHKTMSMFMKELVDEKNDEDTAVGSQHTLFLATVEEEENDDTPPPFLGDSSPRLIIQKSWEEELGTDKYNNINTTLDDLRDFCNITNTGASERVLLFKLRHRRTNNPLLAINQIFWSTFQSNEKQFNESELPDTIEHSIALQLVRQLTNLFEPQVGSPMTEVESVEFVKSYVRWVRINQLHHEERVERNRVVQWIVEYWSTRIA